MIRLHELILPREHGVWGLLAGAALVGLPLGNTLAGLPLLAAGLCAVMLRQALSARGVPQVRRVAILVLGLAAAGLIALTVGQAADPGWLWWLSASILVGAICLVPVSGRPWWTSAIAGVSIGLLAAAIAVAGGATHDQGAVAAAALAMHLTAIVPLVRAQMRPDPRWATLALELHVVALILAIMAWSAGLINSGIPLIYVLGLARTAWLVDKRLPMSTSPARVGSREMAWLLVVALGVHLGIPC